MYRLRHETAAEYILFSSSNGTFTKIDTSGQQNHKTHFYKFKTVHFHKFKRIQIIK